MGLRDIFLAEMSLQKDTSFVRKEKKCPCVVIKVSLDQPQMFTDFFSVLIRRKVTRDINIKITQSPLLKLFNILNA